MSLGKDIYTWVNTQTWIPARINFNVARPADADPWFVMSITSAENTSGLLCNKYGGEMVITVEGYGSERYLTYEVMETLRVNIQDNLRGAISAYDVWRVLSSGAVSSGEIENQMNSYTFDIMVSWVQ